jgi:superfamily II DNA or RNA helicase
MPRIIDNIDLSLLPALKQTLEVADRADFCVGYLNLRGWKSIAPQVERWEGGEGRCCRLLVGMHRRPEEELRAAFSTETGEEEIDNQTALRFKKKLAEEFRQQLLIGTPNNEDEAGLRRFAKQLRSRKVVVKLFLRHTLHAKLYLLFRPDPINPIVGYLGSSNLTMAGLVKQGELNVDVLDHDACKKLQNWFEERWSDRWCIDISEELARIIEESWARETVIPPYHIYVKIAYHLSNEARAGLAEFKIPQDFRSKLFEFQKAAVKIAAHHLNKRGGVLIGDVVGLGKTLMATALARIFEDDFGLETLILCPKNLVRMWQDHRERYRLRGKVLSMSRLGELANLRRYRLVLIDESHNLRNRERKRYRIIHDYIQANDSRCILLSATPYNKSYLDLANQLRLFMPEDRDIGIRPERLLQELTETEFIRRHQCGIRTLAAFEKSEYPDDWRELMRLVLVRRTRSFIQQNYAETDPATDRKFLTFDDGTRSYFPARLARTVKFKINDNDPADQYARLYADPVVDAINKLSLPRYGLGNYEAPTPGEPPTQVEARNLQDLSRAGKRLMGFCRTNLFKRLESSGAAFLQSVERHILRNCVYLHALNNDLALPIGTQEAELLDFRADAEDSIFDEPSNGDEETNGDEAPAVAPTTTLGSEADFMERAGEIYQDYAGPLKRRFKWVRPSLFVKELGRDLKKDNKALLGILQRSGDWDASKDAKLNALHKLLTKTHPGQKVLIFSQFADTVLYLEKQLSARGVNRLAGVTGNSDDPTALAYRFSPVSNDRRQQISPDRELDRLLATDVLSEGQNLQDCSAVVNYDLPWAIIRLVQRAGRVDRIGQKAEQILCYSFLPAEGVERIIRLRARVRQRLQENAEVVGSDEAFFEDDDKGQTILDLYNEKSGILDKDDGEVDLVSEAYQVWKNAITADPSLQQTIPELPNVVFSTKAHEPVPGSPRGVLVYARTSEGNDALAWMDRSGASVTESQLAILRAAACEPNTPALARADNHHQLVQKAVELISKEEQTLGGSLGRPSGARFRTYERLKRYADSVKGTLFESRTLERALQDILRYPLRPTAVDTLNRQLRAGVADPELAQLVVALREEDRLCIVEQEHQRRDAEIICSLGLAGPNEGT